MSKKIILKSYDGLVFEIDEPVALQMQTIANMIEDNCTEGGIKLPLVTGTILAKVIEYCNKHVNDDVSDDDVKNWDAHFMNIDQTTLYALLMAADYLHVQKLFDLSCQKVADMIKGKSSEEIREILNIENDFTPEEVESIKRENQWKF